MPDFNAQITYQATVRGMEQVQQLSKENQKLQEQLDKQKDSVARLTATHEKHVSILQRIHKGTREVHREMAGLVGIFGLVTGGLIAMSKGSESAAIGLENLQRGVSKFFGTIGNSIAKGGAFLGAIFGGASFDQAGEIARQQVANAKSLDLKIQLLNMEYQTLKTQGDEITALQKKQESERIQLEKENITERYDMLKKALDRKQAAETEALRLSMLGLKQQREIQNDFQKGLVGGTANTTSSVLYNFLQGEKQSPGDVLKAFQSTFNRVIADAVSQSLFTTFASGGNFFENFKNIFSGNSPTLQAARTTAQNTDEISRKNDEMLAVLRQIAECTCSTAQRLGGSYTATITPPKVSTAQKIAGVSNLVASVAGLGSMLPMGGGGGGSPVLPNGGGGPSLNIDPSVFMPRMHSGGMVPAFPAGGEVPITAQRGEFVVRRSVAQQNKEMLRDLNSGKKVEGTPNVFIIKANDAASFAQMLSSPSSRNELEIQIIRSIMSNGQIRSIIKSFAG